LPVGRGALAKLDAAADGAMAKLEAMLVADLGGKPDYKREPLAAGLDH